MRWRAPELIGIAVAAVLVIGLGLWNIHLQQQINQDRSALVYQRQVARALATGATVSAMAGTNKSSGGSAALVQPKHRLPAYLIVQGLHTPVSKRVYELWLIHGHAKPVPVTVFSPSGSDPQVVPLPMAATGYTVAAITVEPHFVRAPTGPIVLAGALKA
jgi:anti-sigma-K factor RskA